MEKNRLAVQRLSQMCGDAEETHSKTPEKCAALPDLQLFYSPLVLFLQHVASIHRESRLVEVAHPPTRPITSSAKSSDRGEIKQQQQTQHDLTMEIRSPNIATAVHKYFNRPIIVLVFFQNKMSSLVLLH